MFIGPSMYEVVAHPETAAELLAATENGGLTINGQRHDAQIVDEFSNGDVIVRMRPL